jgi:hypothetical protein
MLREYSIWLLPAVAQEQILVETVSRLSARLGGETFAPHVTIQGDLSLPLESLTRSLEVLAAALPVQRWRVDEVQCSDHFFRCLFLRLGREAAFDFLQDKAQATAGTAEGLSPFPHLSLAYGQPLTRDHANLRETLSNEFYGQEIAFDRLAISLSSKNIPIADWECLAQFALKPFPA